MYASSLTESVPDVLERIERARERGGRTDVVTVVAVTKTHPPDAIRAAVDAGLQNCGENRVQELAEKVETLGRGAATWHLIGHLQRNKVKQALPLFDLMHSLDSLRLAREVSKEAVRSGVTAHCLVQVNASGEPSKGGFEADAGVEPIAEVVALPGLAIVGLMTMAPFVEDEDVLRTTFRRTRTLFDRCGREIPDFEARHLSMGMSNDFELAVEEGSTMVRLGTVLFGERQG